MPPPRLLLVVCTLFVAGCSATDERPPPTTSGPETSAPPAPLAFDVLEERFDRHERLPDGWKSEAGEWTIARDPTAPSAPNVLRGKAGENASSSLRAPMRFEEFDAILFFRIVAGDGSAGLVFAQRGDDHDVVLYSALDATWRLVSHEDGRAKELGETRVPLGTSDDWIGLRVLLQGARLQAWHDSTLVLDVATGDLRAGELGAFVARGATAAFDDLRVEPLTR